MEAGKILVVSHEIFLTFQLLIKVLDIEAKGLGFEFGVCNWVLECLISMK